MNSIFFFLLIILIKTNGEFLSNSFIVLRHIRLSTDDEQYRIRCPNDLNHLTIKLLNYSNENCFNLYSTSINNACTNHHSPCQFHAKPIPLNCDLRLYSDHVDITYQCSYEKPLITPSVKRNPITLHSIPYPTNSGNPEETIAIFLIGFTTVFILCLLICCIWFIRNTQDDDNCELVSHRSYCKEDVIDHLTELNDLCLHVNPFETNKISSLRTTPNV